MTSPSSPDPSPTHSVTTPSAGITPTFTPAIPSPSPSVTPSPVPTYDLAEDVPENVDVWGTHRLPYFNVTLPVPPDWVIEERGERGNTLYGATYQPPLWDSPEDCGYQCPSISVVIYRDTVTITHGTTVDALRTWIEEHSTSEPFGADVDDRVIFFGVERIEETLWDGQQALSFYSEAMGIRSYEVLTIVNGHVVGLSKSHVDRFEFEPVYEMMRTHAMIKTHPLHPTAPPIAIARLCPPASSEAEWECQDLEIAIKSQFPDDIKLRRRYSITDPPIGALEVDVWLPSDADLTTWLEKQNAPNLFPVQDPNGTVGGHPAIFWVTDPPHSSFNALVSDGTYIYKVYYVITCHEDGLPAARQMLDTFRFSGEPAIPADIPEDIWQQALEVCQ